MVILDGWGVAPDSEGNAITRANLPNYSKFLKNYPAMTLFASGNEVGLPFGQMGNSEVGHLNIGAGRVYYQTFPRINQAIADKSFFTNPAFLLAAEKVRTNKSKLHLIGLLGNGNIHASSEHLWALLEFCKQQKISKDVFVHGILDGRDTLYNSGKFFVEELLKKTSDLKVGQLATLSGRYFAMDRDNHYDRTQKAFAAMVSGQAERSGEDPLEIIEAAYAKENFDEAFIPAVITKKGKPVATIDAGDAVIFFNFRPDRMRQIVKAFVLPGFEKFARPFGQDILAITMTEFEKELPVVVAYPPVVVRNCLAEVISKAGLKQLHLAETTKYAHITYFLNGTIDEPFPGEERLLVPSLKVASFETAPEMSAQEITKAAIRAIDDKKFDFLAINYANADMVGHSGNFEATREGAETIDKGLGEVVDHTLARGGAVVITADHGNAEEVINLQTGQIDKEHSTNPVPLIVISQDLMGQAGPAGDPPEGDLSLFQPVGMLADVAPTVLKLLDIEKPEEMTGQALI